MSSMFVPAAYRKDALINSAIRTVLEEFAPTVKRIGYTIGKDWSDEWSIFFRVVTADELTAQPVRQRVLFQEKVTSRIMDELDLPNLELWPHVRFKAESDVASQNDPDWTAIK
jgi:hypothetical protein